MLSVQFWHHRSCRFDLNENLQADREQYDNQKVNGLLGLPEVSKA